MTEKAKERGAIAGLTIATLAGLGCMGAGIWAIATMPKPYINQWVNMADKDFDFRPIMGRCDPNWIASWAEKQDPQKDPKNPKTIAEYYQTRLLVTPEIYVEDYISYIDTWMKNLIEKEHCNFTNNTIRLSDPSITQDEQDKTIFYISYRWDQKLEYTTATNKLIKSDWYISVKDVPITLSLVDTQLGGKKWQVNHNLDSDKWSGKVKITEATGFDPEQKTISEEIEINKDNYKDKLTNPLFYNFDFDSYYLEACIPPEK